MRVWFVLTPKLHSYVTLIQLEVTQRDNFWEHWSHWWKLSKNSKLILIWEFSQVKVCLNQWIHFTSWSHLWLNRARAKCWRTESESTLVFQCHEMPLLKSVKKCSKLILIWEFSQVRVCLNQWSHLWSRKEAEQRTSYTTTYCSGNCPPQKHI